MIRTSQNVVRRFLHNARGATAIEYALIATLVGIGLVGTVLTFGGGLFEAFNMLGNAIDGQY